MRPLRVCMSVLVFVGIAASLSGAPARPAAVASWPQWRGPNRTAISPDQGLNTNWEAKAPKLLWMSQGVGGGYASLSLGSDAIYTTGNFPEGQSIVALDRQDGRVVWKTPITEGSPRHSYEGSRSTPTIDEDRIYAVSSDGKIACVKTDGSPLWRRDMKKEWNGRMMSGWGYSESPLVDGDWVICTPGSQDAMLVALDKMTGQEIWRSAVPQLGNQGNDGAGYSSIVVSQGAGVKQYVQVVGRGVIGVRAADGRYLWHYNPVANGTANIPTPLTSGDFVFASTGYGTGAALLKLSARRGGVQADEVYFLNAKTFQNHHGGMIMIGDHVYAGHGHNDGKPICLNWKTGQVVWGGDRRGLGRGSAAVVYADGHIVYRYQDGTVALVAASPRGFEPKGTFMPAFQERESWSHPVVLGQKLYLREQDRMMCYDLAR